MEAARRQKLSSLPSKEVAEQFQVTSDAASALPPPPLNHTQSVMTIDTMHRQTATTNATAASAASTNTFRIRPYNLSSRASSRPLLQSQENDIDREDEDERL